MMLQLLDGGGGLAGAEERDEDAAEREALCPSSTTPLRLSSAPMVWRPRFLISVISANDRTSRVKSVDNGET
jgi:hypothetical protein